MNKKLISLFSNLSKEETMLLAKRNEDLSATINSETKEKIAKIINQKTNLNLEIDEKREVRKFKAKPFKAALFAAAVVALLAVSVGAAYHFVMPEGFFKDQGNIVFDSVYTIVDTDNAGKGEFKTVHKTVKSNEYTITFEAIAKGKISRIVYENPFSLFGKSPEEIAQAKKWEEIIPDKTYAIFTLKADDGQEILWNKITDISQIGFNVAIKGYDPGSCTIGQNEQYYYEESGVLYYVCDITDAGLFADKELHVSVFGCHSPDGRILRMDENGDPYFVESYDGFKAMFDLNLDEALADSEKAKEYAKEHWFITNPDYSWADEIIAKDEAFEQSGIDLSEFIGDNKWRGSYELQFGEVKMANEYLELQKNRTEEMNIFTCRELYDTINKNATDEFFAGLENYDPEKPEDAQIPIEWLSSNGYTAKLSDGSKVVYLGDQFYIHYENNGDMKLIMVPCHNMVFEFDMTVFNVFNILIRFHENAGCYNYNMGIYIDKEITRPSQKKDLAEVGATLEDTINALSSVYKTEEDAIFALANDFIYHNGIVQVVK